MKTREELEADLENADQECEKAYQVWLKAYQALQDFDELTNGN